MSKDQSYLTNSQIKNDINARHNYMQVGIELEMYSTKQIESTGRFIKEQMGLSNWECVSDGSLYDFREIITNGPIINEKREQLLANPIKFAYEHNGRNFQYIYETFYNVDREMTTKLENDQITPSEFFNFLIDSEVAKQHAINTISPTLDRYDRRRDTERSRYGVEMRLDIPVKFNSARSKLKELSDVSNNEVLCPLFENPENGNSDNEEMRGSNHGMTGLHFHFGLSNSIDYSVLDLFRLAINCKLRESEIEEKAGRPHNRWCKKMDDIINQLHSSISRVASHNRTSTVFDTSWFSDSQSFSLGDARYYGVNVTNIGIGNRNNGRKKLNTIEFRWGNANLAYDYDKLTSYFDLLTDLIDTSFTGSHELVLENGYTLKDISKGFASISRGNLNMIAVISPAGKLVGRIEMPQLCKSFTHKLPHKLDIINKDDNRVNGTNYIPKFTSVINKNLMEIKKNLDYRKFLKKRAWELCDKTPGTTIGLIKEFKRGDLGLAGDILRYNKIPLQRPVDKIRHNNVDAINRMREEVSKHSELIDIGNITTQILGIV